MKSSSYHQKKIKESPSFVQILIIHNLIIKYICLEAGNANVFYVSTFYDTYFALASLPAPLYYHKEKKLIQLICLQHR